jgi:uncharacterized surface anchored protein
VRIFLIIAAISCAYGQTAQLSGVVRDPSRAVVAGASLTARNDGTLVERVAVTNSEGVYEVPFLAPGNYTVTVQAPGFRPLQRTGVKLDVAQSARLDFSLELTTVGESVSVTAGAQLLQSESATVSTVIDRDLIDVLPLNGRSFQSLIALTPGVVMTKATFGEQG